MITQLNWWRLTTIQAGIYICLPAVLGGHILYTNYGLKSALVSLFLGSIILWVISLLYADRAIKNRMILVDLAYLYFGKLGAQISGIAFTISLMGWFAIQLSLMSKSVGNVFPTFPISVINFIMTAIITLNVAKGIGSIGKVANVSIAFLIGFILTVAIKSYQPEQQIPPSFCDISGVPLVIALSISGVIDSPTYFVHSRSFKDAKIAISVVYLLMLPLLALVGIVFAIYSNEIDFITALGSLGGPVWGFVIMLFILLGGWTTNNGNLYSSSIALKHIYSNLNFSSRTVILGAIGFFLTFFDGLQNIESFLSAMSIIVSSFGAALLASFIWNRSQIVTTQSRQVNLLIMVASTVFGFMCQVKLCQFSGFGFLDGFIVCFILSSLYNGVLNWKSTKII